MPELFHWITFAGSQICHFDEIALDQNIFGLDVPMEDSLPVHEFNGFEYLEHVEFDLLVSERVGFALEAFVKIHVH